MLSVTRSATKSLFKEKSASGGKKLILLLIVGLVYLPLGMVGCGDESEPEIPVEQTQTSVVEQVLSLAQYEGNRVYAKEELKEAFTDASLVVRATVVDSGTTMQELHEQSEVPTGQGWAAIQISPQKVLSGTWDKENIFVIPYGHMRQGICDHSPIPSYPYPFTKGENCIFFLKFEDGLSRRCRMEVFGCFEVVPIKKPSNKR